MLKIPDLPDDGFFIIEKPAYGFCPECGECYLRGGAVIVLQLEGKQFIVGQGEDESHQCDHCLRNIQGGFRDGGCLVAIFPDLCAAQEKAETLRALLMASPTQFGEEVVLCNMDSAEAVRFS